jgi:ribosomal protein S18 acetylase RimI-like enzyme
MGGKDWIEDVVVSKDYRRQGIASKLMDMAESASHAELGTNLCSSPRREAAWKMYTEKRGYVRRETNVLRLENKGEKL